MERVFLVKFTESKVCKEITWVSHLLGSKKYDQGHIFLSTWGVYITSADTSFGCRR